MHRLLSVVALLTFTLSTVAHAKVTRLTADQRARLRKAAPFEQVRRKAKVPAPILALVGGADEVADPGQDWQVTDVMGKPLPFVLLDWAATSGDQVLLHYERGGIAHSFHFLWVTWKKGDAQAKVLWHAVGDRPLADVDAFLKALEADQLDDDARLRM